jgi:AcrR family transcriptional regulator
VRESILDAAADVLHTDGLEGLTVRRVVDRASSSTGAYYHHFADKEELLVALVDRLADHIAQKVDALAAGEAVVDVAIESPDPSASTDHEKAAAHGRASSSGHGVRTRLRTMVEAGILAALEERALAQVLFASDYGERVRERIRQRFIGRTVAFFSREPVGLAMVVDPKLIAVLWQGSILMLVEQIVRGELEVNAKEAARICAEWNVGALGPDLRD